jgi:hypothetical protein
MRLCLPKLQKKEKGVKTFEASTTPNHYHPTANKCAPVIVDLTRTTAKRTNSANCAAVIYPVSSPSSRCPMSLRLTCFLVAGGELLANSKEYYATFAQDRCSEALFFARQSEQQMFGADVLMREPLCLFRRIRQRACIRCSAEARPKQEPFHDCGVAFNLIADRFHRRMRTQETIGQGLIFTQESEE